MKNLTKAQTGLLETLGKMYERLPLQSRVADKLQYTIANNVYKKHLRDLEKSEGYPLRFRGIIMKKSKKIKPGTINLGAKEF